MMKTRDFERVSFPIELDYLVPSRGDLQGQAKAANISLGGMGVQLRDRLEVGTKISFQIHFPRQERMTIASGMLVWLKEGPNRKGYEGGVRFLQADPFEFEDLMRVVGRLAAWQSSPAASLRLS